MAGAGDLEVTVTRVRRGAVWHLNLEVPVAGDGHVQRGLAVDHIALHVQLFSGIDLHTRTEHETRGRLGVVGGLTTRLLDVLVQQVLKDSSVALEPGRVHVGQVVRDDVHTRLLRVKTRFGYPQ